MPAQDTPQAPQLLPLVLVSTQAPPQLVVPTGQHFMFEQLKLALPQSGVLQQVPSAMQAPPQRW
jgi:hypothetical protein